MNRKADDFMILQEKYDLVDELLNVLENLVTIYKDLIMLSSGKQSILATNNSKDLQIIAEQEKEIAAIITTLEKRRITLQSDIDNSHTSFNQLITLLEEPRKSRAISLSQELVQVVRSLGVIQEANDILLHNLLKLVKHKRNVLYQVSTVPDYGDNNSFVNNRSIINKII
jgi:hypothetical protein